MCMSMSTIGNDCCLASLDVKLIIQDQLDFGRLSLANIGSWLWFYA